MSKKRLMDMIKTDPSLLPQLLLLAERKQPIPLADSPDRAFDAMAPLLCGFEVERLVAVALDRRRRILAVETLTIGSDAFTVVCQRQIYRWALRHNAHGVILGHNHPSGDPTPSAQDREVTLRVARAGAVLGIPLVDHLVEGSGEFRSLAAEGLLPTFAPGASWTA